MRRALILIAVAGLLPAQALAQSLPARSRAERQVNDINSSIQRQQQIQSGQQQTQFEINQLRQEQNRSTMFPRAGVGGVGCPAGSIGC